MRGGPRGLPALGSRALQRTFEEGAAAQGGADVEALEAIEQVERLREGGRRKGESPDLTERERRPALQRTKRPEVHGNARVPRPLAARTDRTALGNVKVDRARATHLAPAAHAQPELGPQPQGRQGPQLEEDLSAAIGLCLGKAPERTDREAKQLLEVAARAALRRLAVQQLQQEAGEREAPRVASQTQEGIDQPCVLEARQRAAARGLHFDPQVVEEIEEPWKASGAAARPLGDRRQTTRLRHQQVNDPIGLPEVHGAQHERFGRKGGHPQTVAPSTS
jgi:hypothetical protein